MYCTKTNQPDNLLTPGYTCFHGQDATQLEDWLTDVEMAADLTNESRANLAKAKSRGLTCTLIMEAITLDKCREDIKDFLQLKLCNADIHTYISCFMEIQQGENESLAAYIHQFKMEARRGNFTNGTATIQIFIKGLKNTHSLATHIYEMGPQTLTDAISKVDIFQAAQHLTATLILPTTINIMSQEEDCCFQYQEQGHIACHCPNVRCFEGDEYGHIAMDCPHRIPPSGTPANHQ